MKKKLFLHVGLNKTGSSALQSWLSNNHKELGKCGYYYPVTEKKSTKFEISSGNGALFNQYLEGKIDETQVIHNYFNSPVKNVIISKENFNFDLTKINELKAFCIRNKIDLRVIVYVRDVYGWAYSIYVQLVKRHSYVRSFNAFISGLKDAAHIRYASLLHTNIENIDIVHYDTVKSNVAFAFSQCIEVDYAQLKPMAKVKVNRTLTFDEINVVIFISKLVKIYNKKGNNDYICQLASDFLVNTYKERVSEVFVDKGLLLILENKFKSDVDNFNQKVKGDLKLFTEDVRAQSIKSEDLNHDILLDVLRNIISKIEPKLALYLAAEVYLLSESDGAPLIIDLAEYEQKYIIAYTLRDVALFLETVDVNRSLIFMQLAYKLKPTGSLISKKIVELTDKLASQNNE